PERLGQCTGGGVALRQDGRMTLPTPSGRWTTTARPAFAVAAALSLGGNLLSLWIGSWKSSDLPADAGYAGVLEGGWEHMLNQPTYFT
ncbi:hypothetical protein R0K17_25820, partial [Planococcus sp. SIMBA_143]